jgi:hypothetical protein
MRTKDAKEARKLWDELRKSIAQRPSPFEGMTEEEVIEQLRKTRKKLWDKKFAVRPVKRRNTLEGIIDFATDCPDTDLSVHHDKYLYGRTVK